MQGKILAINKQTKIEITFDSIELFTLAKESNQFLELVKKNVQTKNNADSYKDIEAVLIKPNKKKK